MPFRSSDYTADQELLHDVTMRLATNNASLPTKSSLSDSSIQSLSPRNLAPPTSSAVSPSPLGSVRKSHSRFMWLFLLMYQELFEQIVNAINTAWNNYYTRVLQSAEQICLTRGSQAAQSKLFCGPV